MEDGDQPESQGDPGTSVEDTLESGGTGRLRWLLARQTIDVCVEPGQTVVLRPLSTADCDFLISAVDDNLDPGEFAVHVIAHQILGFEQSEVKAVVCAWSSQRLEEVVRVWAADSFGLHHPLPPDGDIFVDFQRAAQSYAQETRDQIRHMTASLARVAAWDRTLIHGLSSTIESFSRWQVSIQRSMEDLQKIPETLNRITLQAARFSDLTRRAMEPLTKWTEEVRGSLSGFVSQLPDLARGIEMARREMEEGSANLDRSGFGFTRDLWRISAMRGLAQLQPETVAAVITNRMLAEIRGERFQQAMEARFTGCSILARRWPAVRAGLSAHARREYLLSVPALLCQLEGVVADALILRGSVEIAGHRVYERCSDGTLRCDKNNRPIEVRGIGQLVAKSDLRNHPLTDAVADLITDMLADRRNAVLHGRDVGYGSARFSAQILLAIHMVSKAVSDFECETGHAGGVVSAR